MFDRFVMNHLQVTERAVKREPTNFAELDPKTMKVGDLRDELEARNLSSKGTNQITVVQFNHYFKFRFKATVDRSSCESIKS